MTTLADQFESIFAQFENFEVAPTDVMLCFRKLRNLRNLKLITNNELVILSAALGVLTTIMARRSGVSMDEEMPTTRELKR